MFKLGNLILTYFLFKENELLIIIKLVFLNSSIFVKNLFEIFELEGMLELIIHQICMGQFKYSKIIWKSITVGFINSFSTVSIRISMPNNEKDGTYQSY